MAKYMTKQRQILLDYFSHHTHEALSAKQIADALGEDQISPSAVYRNLAALEENGLLKLVSKPGSHEAFFVIADATACCQQGMEFVPAGDHKYPDDYPELGTDITVVGEFQTYMEDNYPDIYENIKQWYHWNGTTIRRLFVDRAGCCRRGNVSFRFCEGAIYNENRVSDLNYLTSSCSCMISISTSCPHGRNAVWGFGGRTCRKKAMIPCGSRLR